MPKEHDIIAGKYELVRSLGKGAMGEVYEAVHRDIGKRVALKFLLPQLTASPTAITRFQREARLAAAAGHRGIVDIFDLGETEEGAQFFVMELLEGQSLQEHLFPTRQLDVPTTAYIGCQVLSALAAAHGAGIIHRDLKPANIFLVETGASLFDIKLLDFGISRFVGDGTSPYELSMTQTGAVLGTPAYMSLEQAMGDKDGIDHRSDLYAMGVILFECVTGSLPFVAPNYNSLIVTIITAQPPAPRSLRADLPAELEALILKALSKEQEDRFQSASEMFGALLPFVDAVAAARISLPAGCTLPGRAPREPLTPSARSLRDAVARIPTPRQLHDEPTASPEPRRRGSPAIWAAVGALGSLVVVGGALLLQNDSRSAEEPSDPAPAAQTSEPDPDAVPIPPSPLESDASTEPPTTEAGPEEPPAEAPRPDPAASGHRGPLQPPRPPPPTGGRPGTTKGVYVD